MLRWLFGGNKVQTPTTLKFGWCGLQAVAAMQNTLGQKSDDEKLAFLVAMHGIWSPARKSDYAQNMYRFFEFQKLFGALSGPPPNPYPYGSTSMTIKDVIRLDGGIDMWNPFLLLFGRSLGFLYSHDREEFTCTYGMPTFHKSLVDGATHPSMDEGYLYKIRGSNVLRAFVPTLTRGYTRAFLNAHTEFWFHAA